MSAITETFQANEVATVPQVAVFDSRIPWLEGRNKYIGSSDAPALLGCGYAGDSLSSKYAEKVHGVKRSFSPASRDAMQIGSVLESGIIEIFAVRHPEWNVTKGKAFQFEVSKEHPYLCASLDGWATHGDERIVIEAKCISAANAYEWRENSAPLKYVCQVQHQLIVTGCKRGVIVALVGGEYEERWVERDEALIEQMLIVYRRFWQCVIDRTPPEDDSPIAFESLQVEREVGFGKQLGKEASDKVREVLKLQDEEAKLARRLAIAKSDVSALKLGVEWLVLDSQEVIRCKKNSMEKKPGLPRGVRFK
jgi:predicted phage-related endonuclease